VTLAHKKNPQKGMSKGEKQKLERRIQQLEGEIARLEQQMRLIETHLSDPGIDQAKAQQLGSEYARIQIELEEHLRQWSEIGEHAQNE